jgi:hypothetical protein
MGYRAHCIAMEVRRQGHTYVSLGARKHSLPMRLTYYLGAHSASFPSAQACLAFVKCGLHGI